MPDEDDLTVSYSVKELLGNIQSAVDAGFAGVRASLDTKADKTQIDAITRRLDEHGVEIGELKDRQRADEAATNALTGAKEKRSNFRMWLIGTGISAALVASALIPILTGK
ncbi:MAG TPA: hypothetical protein VFH54_06995 [Mycobacteriales bacterium]|nr:hypothetical protein [Mycobacteriales bacterium]